MTDDSEKKFLGSEEIQGAPPVSSRAEQRERRLAEQVHVNRYLLLQKQQFELMLLAATDLPSLLEVLLFSMPRHFSFQVAELWLYDPENILRDLITGGERYGQHYGQHLQLRNEVFSMQELYDIEPDIMEIDAADTRMFEVLKTDHGIDKAILMPLMDSGRLVGSFHWGLSGDSLLSGPAEEDIVAHMAALISICLKNTISREQISQLSMLDPLTRAGNPRGFERDIAREISRASRVRQPLTVLKVEIDEFEDLSRHHGEVTCQFVLKRVTQRVSSDLRATDYMARLSSSNMAVLIPGSGEIVGQEIAERMRSDIENFAIDDGRGSILQVTLSIGLVTWEPEQFPAVDLQQLSRQIQAAADKGLHASQSKNGNRISSTRLSTLIV